MTVGSPPVRTSGIEEGSLYAALRAVTERSPDAPMVVGYDGAESPRGRLLQATDAIAASLGGHGASCRAVGLALDDPFTFVASYFAAAKLGLVIVLLDSDAAPEEMARLTAKFDLALLVRDGAAGSGSIEVEAVGTAPAGAPVPHHYGSTDFVVHCTSGSTGEPKGVVMSQAAVMERVRSWSREGELGPSDVVLCALPLWHGHGIDVLTLPSLLSGAKVVFTRGRRLTARGLAGIIEKHAVTVVSGLPVMYQMLVAAEGVDGAKLGSLRLALTGSAPISAGTQTQFRERFGLPLRQGYGLGEIGVITYDGKDAGPGTIGLPMPGIEWRLDPVGAYDGRGRICELWVRGPSLARGYYRDAAAEAEMFVDGWLRTHDLVVEEPDGWFIRGRRSSFINVSGNKVAPLEVETALRTCDGVVDCAVAGVPDGEGGEQIAALVVAGPGCAVESVRRQMGARMLPHQLPQKYTFTATVPRTPVGKTDHEAVKRLIEGVGAPTG
ncbi:acyl--CoA ligase (plasmid) [Streptomyces decoyicus]|uniref:class I adenylate-forming enzyme family protein n=1 Tax=Streptomyces decoyicus TaxID=249567 RepID=UPI002E377486|nr:class I adenylate-forming enzyme family protein [Streptomyces decoyicus]